MKKNIIILLMSLLIAGIINAQTVGTGFTYQGELIDNGVPANGEYEISFDYFSTATGGTGLGGLFSPTFITTITNGLFTIENVDFGDIYSNSDQFWIEVYVREIPQLGPPGAYTILSPRQKLMAVPYAVQADYSTNSTNATLATSASKANDLNISGASSGDVLAYNGVNWSSANALHVNGNGGASVGTTNVPPGNGLLIQGDTKVRGDVYQDITKKGLPKYMLNVNCGNGINSVSGIDLTGNNSGFSIASSSTVGYCFIDFPLSLVGQFWIVNAEDNDGAHVSCVVNINIPNQLLCQRVDRNGAYQYGEYQIIVF